MKKIIYFILLILLFLFTKLYKDPDKSSVHISDQTIQLKTDNYLINQNKENKNV
ncbi:MAG: hypothetical protein ABFR75_12200 [Acidobacteriota bacterium]